MENIVQNNQLGLIMTMTKQQQDKYGLARLKSVKTRPSTIAAEEFFSPSMNNNWKTLPSRLYKLVDALNSWVRVFIDVSCVTF